MNDASKTLRAVSVPHTGSGTAAVISIIAAVSQGKIKYKSLQAPQLMIATKYKDNNPKTQ